MSEGSGAAYAENSPARAPRPGWMARVERTFESTPVEYFDQYRPPPDTRKFGAVLMLFAPGPNGDEVVLTERSVNLRSHPGQVSFPGGSLDPGDGTAVAAALRETHEEVGIDPAGVDVVFSLPQLYLRPSEYAVTPVLAWWPVSGDVSAVDPAEVARAAKVPVRDLVDPANRFTVTHPMGYRSPGFEADGLYIWGFTAMLLSTLLDIAGLAVEWDVSREQPLPERLARPWRTG